MESYEQKYKEALERASKLRFLNPFDTVSQMMEHVFPELKESEDERIRKEIISHLQHEYVVKRYVSDVEYDRWIAWLEKQGEQKPIVEMKSPEESLGVSSEEYNDIVNECIYGESTDKVEPKFYKGEWIVWQNKCYKVNYNGCGYELIDQNGLSTSLEYGTIEENAHLWTIQDAKEGDILVGKIDGDDYILIFKQIKDGWTETYGHYYDAVNRFCVPSQLFCRDYKGTFYPATKEQRDLLFQKMKEAGYEWDAEKRELKLFITNGGDFFESENCEQKPTDKVEPKFNFKAGQWIVATGKCVYLIVKIDGYNVTLVDTNGDEYVFDVSSLDDAHEWNIADAKAGDVLVCESGWTCIFKALDNHTNTFSSYCFIDKDKWFCNTGSECHTLDKAFIKAYNGEINPATKEQRDLLFARMKDAGYEWDAEEKELRKIE